MKETTSLPGRSWMFSTIPGWPADRSEAKHPTPSYLSHEEIVVNEQAHETIVSWKVYELAQQTLAARTPQRRAPRSHSSINRFSELAECGHCGQPMHVNGSGDKKVLICKQKKIRASYCPDSHREKLDDVQKPALEILLELLRDETFLNEHVDNVLEMNKQLVKEQEQKRNALDDMAKELNKKISALVDITEDPARRGQKLRRITRPVGRPQS